VESIAPFQKDWNKASARELCKLGKAARTALKNLISTAGNSEGTEELAARCWRMDRLRKARQKWERIRHRGQLILVAAPVLFWSEATVVFVEQGGKSDCR